MDGLKGIDTALLAKMAKASEPAKLEAAASDEAKASDAAEQFESMLMKQMLDSMWSTVPKGELLSGSREEELYRDMLNEAVAASVAEGQGMGVKDVILRDMKKFGKGTKKEPADLLSGDE